HAGGAGGAHGGRAERERAHRAAARDDDVGGGRLRFAVVLARADGAARLRFALVLARAYGAARLRFALVLARADGAARLRFALVLAHRGTSRHGRPRQGSGSRGRPSTRSPTMLRFTSDVPPSMVLARLRSMPDTS